MPDRETLFITGFPGFIANRLLERLARKECDFILLVQPSLRSRALEEIERIAQISGKRVDDFRIVRDNMTGGNRRTDDRLIPQVMFTPM